MSDRSSFEFLIDQLAGLALGFILICILAIPMAVMTSGWGGAAVLIFIVAIFVLCMLSENSGNENKSSNFGTNNSKSFDYNNYTTQKYLSTLEWKICPKCGRKYAKEVKKCSYCGYKFK